MWYNDTYGHEGCLWQGRFYSGVVERKRRYCRRMYNLSQYLNYVGPEIMLASCVATLDSA